MLHLKIDQKLVSRSKPMSTISDPIALAVREQFGFGVCSGKDVLCVDVDTEHGAYPYANPAFCINYVLPEYILELRKWFDESGVFPSMEITLLEISSEPGMEPGRLVPKEHPLLPIDSSHEDWQAYYDQEGDCERSLAAWKIWVDMFEKHKGKKVEL